MPVTGMQHTAQLLATSGPGCACSQSGGRGGGRAGEEAGTYHVSWYTLFIKASLGARGKWWLQAAKLKCVGAQWSVLWSVLLAVLH